MMLLLSRNHEIYLLGSNGECLYCSSPLSTLSIIDYGFPVGLWTSAHLLVSSIQLF